MICNKLCIEVLICKREKNSRKILLDNFSTNFSKGRRLIYLFFKIINLLGGNSKKSNHTFCTEHLMRNFNFYFSLYLVLDLDLQRGMLVPCFYLQIYPQRIVPACISLLVSFCASSLLNDVFLTILNYQNVIQWRSSV